MNISRYKAGAHLLKLVPKVLRMTSRGQHTEQKKPRSIEDSGIPLQSNLTLQNSADALQHLFHVGKKVQKV